ncbi:MAG: hypothetical protein M0R70_12740 [Nitrospirae bacterium]|nr:hypothetical protein [Nitrospirota bacterium]
MVRKKIDRKDKRCHLDFVWLADGEYTHLCALMEEKQVLHWIQELNLYIGSHGKDPYESHYYTIQVWERRAKAGKTKDPRLDPSGAGFRRGTRDAGAKYAADRIIEELKNPQESMPRREGNEKVWSAIYAVCIARKTTWPKLQACLKENPDEEAKIHAEIVKEYKP